MVRNTVDRVGFEEVPIEKDFVTGGGLAVFNCIAFTSCTGLTFVVGSGNIVNKQYDLKDFTNVEVSSAFQVEIDQSSSYSVIFPSSRENVIVLWISLKLETR